MFPLAARKVGIKTVWASEIDKNAISISKRHFPDVEHLGDITKLKARDIKPVDIITFGSPCQNFSKVGDLTGLRGEKSSLFYQAIRIDKGNEVCNKWGVSNFRYLGERHGSFCIGR